MADQNYDEEPMDDEEMDEEGALPPDDSVLDSLSRNLGPVPWWIVSTLFHVVIFILFILMMTEVPKDTTIVTIRGTAEQQVPPPPPDKKEKVEITKNDRLVEFNPDQPPVPDAVVPMEHITDTTHDETDDNMDSSTARGDLKNIGTVNLGGYGAVGVMGVGGGGGGGAYGTRTGGGRHRAAIRGGGSRASEGAVDLALEWLAKHQEPDGHWDTVKYEANVGSGKCDTAATGLATLAFLGAGHTDKRGTYRDNVKRAVDWIMKQQQADGCVMPGANGKEISYGPGYFHAICGLALAECYGMAHSADVKAAAQKAIDYSCNVHQTGQGSDKLGWRYAKQSHPDDISVSGWFIMQLKSARLAGLAVPQDSFQGAIAFLDSVEDKGNPNDPYSGHRYGYTDNKSISPMRTIIGCTARMFLGWPKDELLPAVTWAVDKQGVPSWGNNGADVNWYFWYYGTMTCFQMGGDLWKKWNGAMRDLLVNNQRKDGDEKGSWDPTGTYQNLGRVWSTANGALCLEVYYRYSPLYGPNAHH
ncbi:MAG: prenyltransferase/squalene oxidase repeat-containing protein [Planctomycetota bacterium]